MWEDYFAQNNITDPADQQRIRERYGSPEEYETAHGINTRTSDYDVDVDVSDAFNNPQGGGGGSGWSPEGWRTDSYNKTTDYIRQGVDETRAYLGPQFENASQTLERGGVQAGSEDMFARAYGDTFEQMMGTGTRGGDFMRAARAAAGTNVTGQWAMARDQAMRGARKDLNETANAFVNARNAASRTMGGVGSTYFSMFEPNYSRGGGGGPWHSDISSMSGGRNPTPGDFNKFQQSDPYDTNRNSQMPNGKTPPKGTSYYDKNGIFHENQ
jgi:hypothetical protein